MRLIGIHSALVLALFAAAAAAAPESAPAVQYTRIGVVPLRDEGNLRDGAQRLTGLLAARLDARFEEVEFAIVDPAAIGLEHGPLLLEEAVKLGGEFEVEALLDGVFGGVQILGGTWPNRGSDFPEARGFMRWRLVECSEGLLVADGRIDPDKYTVYSQRIRSSDELAKRVMQDLVQQVGDELQAAGVLAGTEPEPAGEGGADAGGQP